MDKVSKKAWAASVVLVMVSAVVIESEEVEVVVAADAIADETVVSVSLVPEVVQPARRAEESSRPEIAAEIRLLSRMRFNLKHYARKAWKTKGKFLNSY